MEKQQENQNEQVSDPWEAIDVDDSDLHFLRPCKRRHNQPLLPGPASAVQSAMLRRDLSGDPEPVDRDFAADPWLFALDYLRSHGVFEGGREVYRTPLSSIKDEIGCDRVNLVVAIVKSCTRTGLGDLMVTLKDPTGTIGASVHRKVLSEGDNVKNLSVGSVLILKKVAVFAPSCSAYYLNITLSNVIKVISKESSPGLKENYLPSVRYVTQDSESREPSNLPNAVGSQDITQVIFNNLRKNPELRSSIYSDEATDSSYAQKTFFLINGNRENPVVIEKEFPSTEHATADDIVEIGVTEKNINKGSANLVDQPNIFKLDDRDKSSYNTQATNVDKEIRTAIRNENTKEPIVSRTTVPEWTEDELDQLGELLFDD